MTPMPKQNPNYPDHEREQFVSTHTIFEGQDFEPGMQTVPAGFRKMTEEEQALYDSEVKQRKFAEWEASQAAVEVKPADEGTVMSGEQNADHTAALINETAAPAAPTPGSPDFVPDEVPPAPPTPPAEPAPAKPKK
jgi:hypothetical protein